MSSAGWISFGTDALPHPHPRSHHLHTGLPEPHSPQLTTTCLLRPAGAVWLPRVVLGLVSAGLGQVAGAAQLYLLQGW